MNKEIEYGTWRNDNKQEEGYSKELVSSSFF